MNKLLHIILLLTILQSESLSYAAIPDSLYVQINSTDERIAIKALKTLVKTQIDSLPDECLYYARKAHHLAIIIDDDWEIASTNFHIGSCFDHKSVYDSAMYYYEIAKTGFQTLNDEERLVECLNNLGVIYKAEGNYTKALDYQLQALPIRLRLGKQQDICQTYNNLGNLYATTGDTSKAISIFIKGKEIADETNDTLANIFIGTNLSNLLVSQKQYDKAKPVLKQILETSQKKKHIPIEITALNLLAQIEESQNRDKEAFEMASQSLQKARKNNYLKGIIVPLHVIGNYYKKKRDFQKSLEYYLNALNISKELKLYEYQYLMNKSISEIYVLTQQHEKALLHYKRYTVLKDSIFNLENKQQLASIQSKYELEAAENEKVLLEEKIEKQKQYKDFSYVIGGLLLLIIFMLIGLIYNHKRAKKHLIELNEQNNRMFSLISHDLRGPIGNIKSIFKLIDDGDIDNPDEIKSIISESKEIVDSSYDLLENLLNWVRSQTGRITTHPQQIVIAPLVHEILKIFDSSVTDKNLRVSNQTDESHKVFADLEMTKSILRNLISNAIKFTHPDGEISIRSRIQGGYIIVTISDSGMGMDKNTIRKILDDKITSSRKGTHDEKGSGIGLRICRDFVKRNGGKMEIESEIGKGSHFSFSLPVG